MFLKNKQKYFLLLSVVVSLFSALLVIPLLTRKYDIAELATISKLIFIGVMFGSLDVFKPVLIQYFSKMKRVSASSFFLPVQVVAFSLSAFFLILLNFFLENEIFLVDYLIVSISLYIFICSTPFWGVLDANGFAGLTLFTRAICIFIMYLSFLLNDEYFPISTPLLICNIVALSVLFFLSFKFVDYGSLFDFKLKNNFITNVGYTFSSNLSKLVIDFLDRIFVGKFFSETVVAAYNILYDVTSKSNYISNIYCSYMYPKLCAKTTKEHLFVYFGTLVCSTLAGFSLLLYFYGDLILSSYLGPNFTEGGAMAALFLLIASIYSTAYFSQALYRSRGNFAAVSKYFLWCAILGLLLIYPLYSAFGLSGVFLSLLTLKSPGVFLFYRDVYSLGKTPVLAGYSILMFSMSVLFFMCISEINV